MDRERVGVTASQEGAGMYTEGAVRSQACQEQENVLGVKVSYSARPCMTQEKSGLHPGASQAVGAHDKIGALGSWASQQRGEVRRSAAMVAPVS